MFDNENDNNGIIAAKSESRLKIELYHVNDPKNTIDKKKSDMNLGKIQYNDEYLNLCGYSNRIYITSNNNKPINIFRIDSNNQINNKEKEEINFNNYTQKENENLLSNVDFMNNNNENKRECDFGLFKNNNIENKPRKDSIVSDYSFFGSFNNLNQELNVLFN